MKKKNDTTKQPKQQKRGVKTAQDTLAYERVYKNGIFEIEPHWYSKSYRLQDVNFTNCSDEDQESIYFNFFDFLNSFDCGVNVTITWNSRSVDKNQFKKEILMSYKNDNLDSLREENNKILLRNIENGQNALHTEKYITVSLYADDIQIAKSAFSRIDGEVSKNIKKITKEETPPMSAEERLGVLYDILHMDTPEEHLNRTAMIDGETVHSFDLASIHRQGLSSKDVIAPDDFNFRHRDYFKMGETYARALFLHELPVSLSTNFIEEITNLPFNMVTSVFYEPQQQDKVIKMIRNQIVNVNSNVIDAQKKATKNGYSESLISPTLRAASEEAENLLEDMTTRNQKMFFATMSFLVFGNSLEQLDRYTDTIKTTGNKYLCKIKTLTYEQEAGLNSALPLGQCKIRAQKMMPTESASVLLPFSTVDYTQKNGLFYGNNAINHNMIIFNRLLCKNQNGVILGTPGSGKSFATKQEMISSYLTQDCDVFIIDPEREYPALANALNGEVVRIAPGGATHINPFDMDIEFADEDDPVTLKVDFIMGLCETMVSSKFGLSPIQHSIIDRCVRTLYKPYVEEIYRTGKQEDTSLVPDMRDLFDLLMQQPEPEAQSLALSIEMYARGSLNTFSFKTNVKTNSRFTVYDIKDIGSGMKELGLQVCLNDIWNRIIANHRKGRRTYLYIDEFHLLLQQESSSLFLQSIWKRARKWGGVLTAITQNVEDLLLSPAARSIINNSDFKMLLNQSPLDKMTLAEMLNISEANQEYITNADPGQGLIFTGKTVIPFVNQYPTDTELYRIMSTKLEDKIMANSAS